MGAGLVSSSWQCSCGLGWMVNWCLVIHSHCKRTPRCDTERCCVERRSLFVEEKRVLLCSSRVNLRSGGREGTRGGLSWIPEDSVQQSFDKYIIRAVVFLVTRRVQQNMETFVSSLTFNESRRLGTSICPPQGQWKNWWRSSKILPRT